MRTVSADTARALLAARKDAKVNRFGIRHERLNYVHPELHEMVGETVQIAFAPHDQRSVEVYWRGDWVSTAVPQVTLTAEQQVEVIHARKAYAKELRARQRSAARAARTRIAPLTATEPAPVETTRLSERDAEVAQVGPAPAARTDLLVRPGPPRARRTAIT
jgi:putative transposase